MSTQGNILSTQEDVQYIGYHEYTLIRVSWAASGSLLKFPLCVFNDYDDNWSAFESQQAINLNKRQIILILHSDLSISFNRKTAVIQIKIKNCQENLRIKTCRTESDRFDKFSLSIRPQFMQQTLCNDFIY